MTIREGSTVSWTWGASTATGTVTTVHRQRVTRTIDGATITRNATPEEPTYEIEQEDGSRVLKSATEVHRA
jgi:hypothetical protein